MGRSEDRGPKHLDGRRVLPGLVDAHIHAMDIVDLDFCDLKSEPHTLRELSSITRACLATDIRRRPAAAWSFINGTYTTGNQPDAEFTTLRVGAG